MGLDVDVAMLFNFDVLPADLAGDVLGVMSDALADLPLLGDVAPVDHFDVMLIDGDANFLTLTFRIR